MLSHFSVKNYKCLADVSLPLTPIHVLIGENDTGKSSLLEAIRAAVYLSTVGAHARKPMTETKIIGEGHGIARHAFPNDWSGTELISRRANPPTLQFFVGLEETKASQNRWTWYGELGIEANQVTLKLGFGSDISKLPMTMRVDLLRLRASVMTLPSALLPTAQYTLHEDGFGLPTLLDAIKDYDINRFQEIQSKLHFYFPRYTRIRLENAPGWTRTGDVGQRSEIRGDKVGKQVWLVSEGGDIRLQNASDGTILLLGFLAVMHSPKPPNVLLIEEPENGIHPKRLIEVAKLLRQFVEREENAPQIIMTTHSPYLLSEFQPEEVTLMRRQPDGSAKAFPLRDAPHIRERMGEEFYLGELWYNLDEEELLK